MAARHTNTAKTASIEKSLPQLAEHAAFQVNRPHDFDEITRRDNVCDVLRPLRHGVYRSHQPAHQLENDDEKEHHIHTLLHGGRTVGNGNTEPRHNEAEKQRHHIDDPTSP